MEFLDKALEYHKGKVRSGKIGTEILTSVKGKEDLSLAYSPGVAVPCLEIKKDLEKIYEYTSKGNRVAVISNGTAVLGLGNIGSAAGKPVMEGKALLFKHFADIDAVDVEINSENVEEVIKTIELISGTFGGINLEDFKAPECFEIEEKLKEKLSIPVFHDDQHGTAIVVGAGLLNALKIVGKKFEDIKVVVNGAGSAGIAISKMLLNLGINKNNLKVCDSKGLLSTNRDLDKSKMEFAFSFENSSLQEVVKNSDVFIGVSVADVFSPEMLKSMNDNPIVFALANPNPEIKWDLAHKTRDDIFMATGRSDFPNQVNNVLAFPGIFRGALDCRASKINEDMKIVAVYALANLVENPTKEVFIVNPFDKRIVPSVAFAVANSAVKNKIAKENFDLEKYKLNLSNRFYN